MVTAETENDAGGLQHNLAHVYTHRRLGITSTPRLTPYILHFSKIAPAHADLARSSPAPAKPKSLSLAQGDPSSPKRLRHGRQCHNEQNNYMGQGGGVFNEWLNGLRGSKVARNIHFSFDAQWGTMNTVISNHQYTSSDSIFLTIPQFIH